MDIPQPETWDFWNDGAHAPSFNMAADEVLLETALLRKHPLLRFYSWNTKAVSIGYFQQHTAAPAGYAYVRRPTGGGVVYHDFDFTYTVVFPDGHWLTGLDRNESYDWINRCIQSALDSLKVHATLAQGSIPHDVDRLTMVCFTNPTRYDVLLDGTKIAGSAQRRTADGILHQGSLHFGGPLPFTRAVLGKAITDAFTQLMSVSFQEFVPDNALETLIQQKQETKYATKEWNDKR